MIFLLVSMTSLIQPMDQGVNEAMKRLITHILECKENLNEVLKKINEKDIIYLIAQAVRKCSYDLKIIPQNNCSKEERGTAADRKLLILPTEQKGVKTFWKRTLLKTNTRVFKSLMIKKLYKLLIPHRTLMMPIMKTRSEYSRIKHYIEGVQSPNNCLKYLEQRGIAITMPTEFLLLKNLCDQVVTNRLSGLMQ